MERADLNYYFLAGINIITLLTSGGRETVSLAWVEGKSQQNANSAHHRSFMIFCPLTGQAFQEPTHLICA